MNGADFPFDSADLLQQNDLYRPAIVGSLPFAPAPGVFFTTMQRPRAPHIAEREELDAALAAGTIEALLLFIERHPDSRYRPEADSVLRQSGITSPKR